MNNKGILSFYIEIEIFVKKDGATRGANAPLSSVAPAAPALARRVRSASDVHHSTFAVCHSKKPIEFWILGLYL